MRTVKKPQRPRRPRTQTSNLTPEDEQFIRGFSDRMEGHVISSRAIPIATMTTFMMVFFAGALWMTLQVERFEPHPDFFFLVLAVLAGVIFTRPFKTFKSRWGRYLSRSYSFVKVLLILPSLILSYALLYRCYGLLDGDQWTNDPDTCLYFSIVTWTTLGYGDVRPTGFSRAVASSEALLGHLVMTLLIAMLAIKFRYVVNEFQPDELVRAPKQSTKEKLTIRRLFASLEALPPEAIYFSVSWYGMGVVLFADILVIHWLFYASPQYSGFMQIFALYGFPFLIAGMLVHGKLFVWRDELGYYYERSYFALKAVFAIPGIIMAYASSYRVLGLVDGTEPASDVGTALYFSIVTWTTLGFGDVQPVPQARLLAASEAMMGYLIMAVFVGLFANVFLRFFSEVDIPSTDAERLRKQPER